MEEPKKFKSSIKAKMSREISEKSEKYEGEDQIIKVSKSMEIH